MTELGYNALMEQTAEFEEEVLAEVEDTVVTDIEFEMEDEEAETAELAPSPARLVGNWVNNNGNTRGLVRVLIRPLAGGSASGINLAVRAFGKCHPTPCDWGWVRGASYSRSVSSARAIAFHARYRQSFKVTELTGYLVGATLVVETYSRFTDGSNRFNYFSREFFHKV